MMGADMRIMVTTALAATLALSGCGGGSGWNPLGWFGGGRDAPAAGPEQTNPLIPQRSGFRRPEPEYDGVPVQQVLDLRFEPVSGGAIVHARGLSATLGAFDLALVPSEETQAEGTKEVLDYTLSARYSARSRPPAPKTSRELNVATFLSDEELRGVRTIRVNAASNSRSVRRR